MFHDPVGKLREQGKILGSDVLAIARPAKEETAISHVPFRILSVMPDTFRRSGNDLN
jgi:hypothetical protein